MVEMESQAAFLEHYTTLEAVAVAQLIPMLLVEMVA
jgi:hypothetical protein